MMKNTTTILNNPSHTTLLLLLLLSIFYVLLCSSLLNPTLAKSTTYNVLDFGAIPDGITDSTMAFLTAWNIACASTKPVAIHVPQGQFLLASATTFRGKCNNNAISITIHGTLLAPYDYRVIGDSGHWLTFDHVSGVAIHGGVLDGQGSSLWNCKKSHTKIHCPIGATSLAFNNSEHIVITGLKSVNSQLFHIIVIGSHNVKVHGVKLIAPGNSPNTDGIHIQFSSHVTILKPRIHTGDDCISIGPGTNNLWIEDVACGPGHGISIGSLGWHLNEPGVKNVTVRRATFSETQNGFRIKSWGRDSKGFVNDIHFEHALMTHVQNPIVIDQNYCPFLYGCPSQASGIKISDVTYKDISGTSATQVAVKFDCSSTQPCTRIRLEDVKLSYKNQNPRASCIHAGGTALGALQPESCL